MIPVLMARRFGKADMLGLRFLLKWISGGRSAWGPKSGAKVPRHLQGR